MTATITKFRGNPRPVKHFRLNRAVIVILPVIRIERLTEAPKRRRKRRGIAKALMLAMS